MNIYSIGDPKFLAEVFNGVAMITGSDDYFHGINVAASLGVLYFFISGVMKNEFPKLQNMLIGWILLMGLIVPKTSVTIQSVVTQEVEVVANVPVGAAFPASLLSTISYYAADAFEEALQPVTTTQALTKGGFIDPLKTLVSIRQLALSGSPAFYHALNNGDVNNDFIESATMFITRCTIPAINTNQKPVLDLSGASLLDATALQDSVTGGQTIIKINGAEEIVTCQKAHADLVAYLNSAITHDNFKNVLIASLTPQKGLSKADGYDPMTKAEDAQEIINGATVSAYQFVNASIWQAALERATQVDAASNYDTANYVMVEQAIQKRNTEWSTLGNGFIKQVPNFATFVEGLVYSTIPLVGFLLAFGAQTLTLVGKYFGLLVWVGFWMPTMSVANMFSWHVAKGSYDKYMSGFSSDELLSYSGLQTTSQALESAIATGSYMMALTPVLAMFFAYGSSQVLSALSGRFVGGGLEGKVNTSAVAPEAINNAAVSQGQMYNTDATRGTYAVGAPENRAKLNVGETLANQASRMKTEAFTAQTTASDEAAKSYTHTKGADKTFGSEGSLAKKFGSGSSSALKAAFNAVNSMESTKGLSEDEKVAFNSKVAANLQAGMSVGDALNAAINSTTGIDKSKARSESISFTQKAGLSDSSSLSKDEQASLTDTIDAGLTTTTGQKWSESAQASNGRNLKDVLTEARTKTDQAGRTELLAKQLGSSASVDTFALREMMKQTDPAQRQKLMEQYGGKDYEEMIGRMLSTQSGQEKLAEMFANSTGYGIGPMKGVQEGDIGAGMGNGAGRNVKGVRKEAKEAQDFVEGKVMSLEAMPTPQEFYESVKPIVEEHNVDANGRVTDANLVNNGEIDDKKAALNKKVDAVINDPEFQADLKEAGIQTSSKEMGVIRDVLNWAADSDVTTGVAATAVGAAVISKATDFLPAGVAKKALKAAGTILEKGGMGTSEKARDVRDALAKVEQNVGKETTSPRRTAEQIEREAQEKAKVEAINKIKQQNSGRNNPDRRSEKEPITKSGRGRPSIKKPFASK